MGRQSVKDFNLSDTESEVIPVDARSTRHDIYVDGIVDVVIEVNGVEKTIGSVNNTLNNFYCSTGFKVVASGGTAVGKVVSVTNDEA